MWTTLSICLKVTTIILVAVGSCVRVPQLLPIVRKILCCARATTFKMTTVCAQWLFCKSALAVHCCTGQLLLKGITLCGLTFTQTIKWTDCSKTAAEAVNAKSKWKWTLARLSFAEWRAQFGLNYWNQVAGGWISIACPFFLRASETQHVRVVFPSCSCRWECKQVSILWHFLLCPFIASNDLAILQLTTLLASAGSIRAPPRPSSTASAATITSSATVVAFVVVV